MKSAYLLSGIRFSNFFRLVFRNGVSILPKYLGRFFFIFQSSIWASIFSIKERKIYNEKIKAATLPTDPIIIIGHWRTGSTFLHQLFNLDSQIVTPNVFQCSVPDSFLSSRKSFEPVMGKMLKGTRPMDQVKLGMDEPLEDEYALFRLSVCSPLERLIFPKSGEYFLNGDDTFLPVNEKERVRWKNALELFYKKLTVYKQGQLLIKNPFHSLRIEKLLDLFPNARFIHIVRNPDKVVPSTINMWDIVGKQNALNPKWKKPDTQEVSRLFKKIVNKIDTSFMDLSQDRTYVLKFEDLEIDPFGTMEKLYDHFKIDFSEEYKAELKDFLGEISSYKKNTYSLPEEEKAIINKELSDYMKKYNYH